MLQCKISLLAPLTHHSLKSITSHNLNRENNHSTQHTSMIYALPQYKLRYLSPAAKLTYSTHSAAHLTQFISIVVATLPSTPSRMPISPIHTYYIYTASYAFPYKSSARAKSLANHPSADSPSVSSDMHTSPSSQTSPHLKDLSTFYI